MKSHPACQFCLAPADLYYVSVVDMEPILFLEVCKECDDRFKMDNHYHISFKKINLQQYLNYQMLK